MGMVAECSRYNRLWNERLDDRDGTSPLRDEALAEHVARCETCRCRESVAGDFERLRTSLRLIPPPSAEALGRWQAAALAGRRARRWALPGRAVRCGGKWAGILGLAAAVFLIARAAAPPFFAAVPDANPDDTRAALSPLIQDAFTEASALTRQLASELAGPADRISTQALGSPARPALAAPEPTGHLAEVAPSESDRVTPAEPDSGGIGLISNSAQHEFRLLGGRTNDESEDSELGEGS